MPLPRPKPGQVIRYSYLWHSEYVLGREEGVKDRPCAVVLVVTNEEGDEVVTVLPITHTPPPRPNAGLAIEIPAQTKRRLGLDSDRSWIVLSEVNRFTWPGPDLRMTGSENDPSNVVYGLLPRALFERVRVSFLAALTTNNVQPVARSD